ncbi:MAG: hypothetical protein Q4G26_16715, partial [Paracoccus sp. (in: a-proteobacteria)]|nr:hypothetical protein [Paracoccus sp. (in: a-proteobacteria)]
TLLERRVVQIGNARLDGVVKALEARARHSGITLADPMIAATRAERKAAAEARAAQIRDMRAPWYGCNAGRAMAAQVSADFERADLWSAICHIRATQIAYDRAIGAPNRHAQCLRLLAPVDALHADATSPPLDMRTDDERKRQAVTAWRIVERWMMASGVAAGECRRVVIDDQRCRDPRKVVRALYCVVDGIKGRKIVC